MRRRTDGEVQALTGLEGELLEGLPGPAARAHGDAAIELQLAVWHLGKFEAAFAIRHRVYLQEIRRGITLEGEVHVLICAQAVSAMEHPFNSAPGFQHQI